jgi:hypothetical protein
MQEWLESLRSNPRFKRYGVYLLFIIISLLLLDKIALFSDLGFSEEVKKYRWLIIFIVLLLGLFLAFANEYRLIRSERNSLKSCVDKLTLEKADLEQQKESLLRLMEAYKSEAQEDIFNRLKQLAVFSIKREEWSKKAKVERFRIEELSGNGQQEINIIDSTTVIINLGIQDDAMKGMQFIVQDPTDTKKYGVIRVKECFNSGSSCSIIEMNHPAFWSEIQKIGEEKIIEAPANVITPYTPFRELNAASAKQTLEWIQNLEEIDL